MKLKHKAIVDVLYFKGSFYYKGWTFIFGSLSDNYRCYTFI